MLMADDLDSLPIYNITHAIRSIIIPRVETTLTWDQLRSPQVSQFLIKPMQQQIRASYFNRATLHSLLSNALQFSKEAQLSPGNMGTSATRAMVCQLLALKLIKEYNTRELIDALSYDFYPLQGAVANSTHDARQSNSFSELKKGARGGAARISTLEIAIRAQAKRFLAHPLVVQQLEAIWAGTIVFHSTADHLHRTPAPRSSNVTTERSPLLSSAPSKSRREQQAFSEALQVSARRTVTLYDPRDASLFKLSRLRVPRYRQFFSTCSLAILLGLFLAVLSQRSSRITRLEIVFWLWSAGFMLDEVVGFNEQGFSLYLMSFWNTFDLGILLIFFIYYCMRLYGMLLTGSGRHDWDSMAYDVLAANAVLLFPRLFSVLDHYRYFSQLLIAFRLMFLDLLAVFVLIVISCSGFFVAFTLSFGEDYDAGAVAYSLFQMLMGFTPAAWSIWDQYNILGQAILTLFLFMCHFLIVTILITVLTNSFMAIVSNANEEHQFVFAVNTISMVKSDALFSYVAPSNVLAWFLTPLRFVLPFRQYVKVNRLTIKLTHFPLLWAIFVYEKLFLARKVYEPTDLVENKGKIRKRLVSFMDPAARAAIFSPGGVRLRAESLAGVHKDRALEDVFRLAPKGTLRDTMRTQQSQQTKNVVDNWMDQQQGLARSPPEQDRSIVERLEGNRLAVGRGRIQRARLSREISGTRSIASDPAEFMSTGGLGQVDGGQAGFDSMTPNLDARTEDDGDDELVTNDEEENTTFRSVSHSRGVSSNLEVGQTIDNDYFQTPRADRRLQEHMTSPHTASPAKTPPTALKRRQADRHASTTTILFNPETAGRDVLSATDSTSSPVQHRPTVHRLATGTNTPSRRLAAPPLSSSKPRPILPHRSTDLPRPQVRKRRSSLDIPLDLGSDFGLHNDGGNGLGMPSSFQTQMAMATAMEKRRGEGQEIMSRIMLARMKTLEEGFAEVVSTLKENRSLATSKAGSVEGGTGSGARELANEMRMRRGRKSAGVRSRPGTASRNKAFGADQDDDYDGDDAGGSGGRDKGAKGSSL